MDNYGKNILASLDQAITTGPWDKSLFLRAIGKQLRDLRHDFSTRLDVIGADGSAAGVEDNLSAQHTAHAQQRMIYVSLYNAEGDNLNTWKRLLLNLGKYIVTRSIYHDVKAVQALIRSKAKKNNEAYVAVKIKTTDILSNTGNQTIRDRLGQELIMVADDAVQSGQIAHFAHVSGFYKFTNNTLVRQSDIESAMA